MKNNEKYDNVKQCPKALLPGTTFSSLTMNGSIKERIRGGQEEQQAFHRVKSMGRFLSLFYFLILADLHSAHGCSCLLALPTTKAMMLCLDTL
jgi:hypothetical protein